MSAPKRKDAPVREDVGAAEQDKPEPNSTTRPCTSCGGTDARAIGKAALECNACGTTYYRRSDADIERDAHRRAFAHLYARDYPRGGGTFPKSIFDFND